VPMTHDDEKRPMDDERRRSFHRIHLIHAVINPCRTSYNHIHRSLCIMRTSSLLVYLTLTGATAFAPNPSSRRVPFCLFSDTGVSIKDVTSDTDERMVKSVESVKQNLSTVRTGRASVNMLDRVKVDYYGLETPLNQMATISVPSAQQLQVDPYDKSQLSTIEKAIIESSLGLTPNSDGNLIRINIPEMTEDRRKDMLKSCKAIGEEGKVAIRNIRRDGQDKIKKMEKAGDLGEDEMKDGLDLIQKMTDQRVKEVEAIVSEKEKAVMKV
jgi:ribosome recycling factor